jgi:hypothetical protein
MTVFTIIAAALAALVFTLEVNYYVGHPYRHGVSPHFIALSLAVVFLAIDRFRDKPQQ